ncbi:MAG: hypothetical protein V2A76_12375 [Planctomycetota bacterium]
MERPGPPATLRNHVVICNCNSKVRRIVREIFLAAPDGSVDVLLIIQDERLWNQNPKWHPEPEWAEHTFELIGAPGSREVLARANVKEARAAVILADPPQGELADARTTLLALAIEAENREVHTVVELVRSENRAHLAQTAVDDVVCVGAITEKLIAQSCVTPWVKDLVENLLSSEPGTAQTFLPGLPGGLLGYSYRQIARAAILGDAPYVVCGFARFPEDGHRGPPAVFISPRAGVDPGKDTPLTPQDRLIVLGTDPPDLDQLVPIPRDPR